MRDKIVSEIRRLAASDGGKPPGRMVFERETGIRYSEWYGVYWSRWGDAVKEAGLQPNSLQARLSRDEVLVKIARACRELGKFPTHGDLRLYARNMTGFPSHSTITSHFISQQGLAIALSDWIKTNLAYEDVATLIVPFLSAGKQGAKGVCKDVSGWVYLIKSGDHFKIGRSDELERRIKEIRIALPEASVLLHSIETDDPSGIEAYWHRRFAAKRANGEWFKLTREDIIAFKRRKYQ